MQELMHLLINLIDNTVYYYIKKKEDEGKPKKVAKIAWLNKFFHIYYAKVRDANLAE